MAASNIFENIPAQLKQERFDTLVQNEHVTIERIVSKGHTSPESGWYEQNRNEWVMVLQGAATILFENGNQMRLQAGDHLNIPALSKHKVLWTDPDQKTIWLAVHYD